VTGGPTDRSQWKSPPIRAALAASALRPDGSSLFGDRLYVELQRHGIEKDAV